MNDDWSYVFPIVTVIAIAFFLGAAFGSQGGERKQQRLAIKAGVARYVPDEQGSSKFEYIEKK